jgi:hypothetical protein
LRSATEERNTFYLDVILEAFVTHAGPIQAAHDEVIRSAHGVTVGRVRRRRPSGRTQIPLVIPSNDLAAVDAAAARLDLDRSAYVAELLDAAL